MENIASLIAQSDLFDSTEDCGDGTLYVEKDGVSYFVVVQIAEVQS